MNFNAALFFQIYNLSQKNFVLDQIMIFGANYLIFFVYFLIIVLAVLGKSKERKPFVLSILGLGLALSLTKIIRIFVQEPRPFITYPIAPLIPTIPIITLPLIGDIGGVNSLSFPSVHALIISTITFSYLYFKSSLTPWLLISLFWIGFARVFVGVHYPLDILGGILLGFISVFLARLAIH